MKKFEYKTVVIELKSEGFWNPKVSSDATAAIETKLNQLGNAGWQLTGAFPVTDGGSPAQINKAVHHFMREIPSG